MSEEKGQEVAELSYEGYQNRLAAAEHDISLIVSRSKAGSHPNLNER